MIKLLEPAQTERWDKFVLATSGGSFFHLAAWQRVIKQAFGHPTYYYYCERDGQITGILPLTHIKSPLFGNTLVSNAFCVYGGILASDDQSFTAYFIFTRGKSIRNSPGERDYRLKPALDII